MHFYYSFRISVKARTYVNRDNEWLRDILCVPRQYIMSYNFYMSWETLMHNVKHISKFTCGRLNVKVSCISV